MFDRECEPRSEWGWHEYVGMRPLSWAQAAIMPSLTKSTAFILSLPCAVHSGSGGPRTAEACTSQPQTVAHHLLVSGPAALRVGQHVETERMQQTPRAAVY